MPGPTDRDTPVPGQAAGPEPQDIVSPNDTLTVAEERATIEVVRRDAGGVRVRVVTEETPAPQSVRLQSETVEITRHPVGREVDSYPAPREEGDLLIVPVVEERAVVVTRLVVTEEIHIRRVRSTDTVDVPVTLRRQRAVIEDLEPPSAGTDPASGV